MITTHVLDTTRGGPAAAIRIVLEISDGSIWREVGRGVTDANGRVTTLSERQTFVAGTYRLTFGTGDYHRRQGISHPFFPDVQITFAVADPGDHYHVPLLLSPFGYSTYRGT